MRAINGHLVVLVLCCLTLLCKGRGNCNEEASPKWLVNLPRYMENKDFSISHLKQHHYLDKAFSNYVDDNIDKENGVSDGEFIDAVEHFFWGQTHGLALELGAADGSMTKRSVSSYLEKNFDWRRVLIDGNPVYLDDLKLNSHQAISVSAVVCDDIQHPKHFALRPLVGGIIEYMSAPFLRRFYPDILKGFKAYGSLDKFDWLELDTQVNTVTCTRLSDILSYLRIKHINWLVLDAEGAELEVLKSIDWEFVRFDVLTVETSPVRRGAGLGDLITAFLMSKGYETASEQVGRNLCKCPDVHVPSHIYTIAQYIYNT